MVTRTKPKKQPDIYQVSVKFNGHEREDILAYLEYWNKSERQQKAIIKKLEQRLTIYFNWLRRLRDQPTPASIHAELHEIDELTTKLTGKLHPNTLSTRSAMLLGCQNGELWSALTYLAMNARLGIERLEKVEKSDGGAQNQREKNVRENIKVAITDFFDSCALRRSDASQKDINETRQDFLDICLGKMPTPSARKRSYKA